MKHLRRALPALLLAASLLAGPVTASADRGDGVRSVPLTNAHTLAPVPGGFALLQARGEESAQTLTLLVHATHLQQPAATELKVTVYDEPQLCVPPHPTPLGTVCAPPNQATLPAGSFLVQTYPNQPVNPEGRATFLLRIPGTHPAGAEVQFSMARLDIQNTDNTAYPKAIAYFPGLASTTVPESRE